jgi:hypothetical protein
MYSKIINKTINKLRMDSENEVIKTWVWSPSEGVPDDITKKKIIDTFHCGNESIKNNCYVEIYNDNVLMAYGIGRFYNNKSSRDSVWDFNSNCDRRLFIDGYVVTDDCINLGEKYVEECFIKLMKSLESMLVTFEHDGCKNIYLVMYCEKSSSNCSYNCMIDILGYKPIDITKDGKYHEGANGFMHETNRFLCAKPYLSSKLDNEKEYNNFNFGDILQFKFRSMYHTLLTHDVPLKDVIEYFERGIRHENVIDAVKDENENGQVESAEDFIWEHHYTIGVIKDEDIE